MFVQVGRQAINMDLVSDIYFGDDHVSLSLLAVDGDGQCVIRFSGPEYYAFLEWWEKKVEWWEKKVDVYVCYVEGE